MRTKNTPSSSRRRPGILSMISEEKPELFAQDLIKTFPKPISRKAFDKIDDLTDADLRSGLNHIMDMVLVCFHITNGNVMPFANN